MWKFKSRHCANAITHIRRSDLTESFTPIIIDFPFGYSMEFSSWWNIIVGFLDDTNYFQNTILAPDDIFYVPMPPYYLQWFMWRQLWINIKYIKWGWHVLQSCNVIQGTKMAAWNWLISLDTVLTSFGLINLPCEQAVYVLDQYCEYMIVILSTDDFLCLYPESSTFHCLLLHVC